MPLFESIDTTGAGKVTSARSRWPSGVTQDLFDAHDFDGNGTLDATEYEGMKAELAALG